VPIEQARILQRQVDAVGARDLVVQRVIRDPDHCGFTNAETVASFEALTSWVEHDRKPDGDDVLTADLANLRPNFELQPRPGTPEADRVPGAHDRLVMHGIATVDGAPLEAPFFGADVVHDGLTAHCELGLSSVRSGAFEVTVQAETEAAGCGATGATIVLWTYTNSEPTAPTPSRGPPTAPPRPSTSPSRRPRPKVPSVAYPSSSVRSLLTAVTCRLAPASRRSSDSYAAA
jgi:hypothetical protein